MKRGISSLISKRHWSIKKANVVIIVSTTMLALIFLTVSVYFATRNQLKEQNILEKQETIEKLSTDLESEVHLRMVKIQTIYTESALTNNMRNRLPSGANLRKFYWSAGNFADKRFDVDDQLVSLYIYDSDNTLVSSYRVNVQNYPQDIYNTSYDINSEKVKEYIASDTTDTLVTGYYNQLAGKNIVRIVMKLHDYDEKRKNYGYIVCEFNSSIFTDILEKYISSNGEIAWVQGEMDTPICSFGNASDGLKWYELIAENFAETKDYKAASEYGDFYCTSGRFSSYPLHIYLLTSRSLLNSTLTMLVRNLIIAAVVMGILASLFGISLSRVLLNPLEDFKNKVTKIATGDMDVRINTAGWSEELEVLGDEFNHMLDQIQDMIIKQYENQLLMERTEYQALQAQINPHFLYNTLNTMSGIAISQSCPMVSELCQSLSIIFRYSIDISAELSNIQLEMRHVQNYLFVMDVRQGFIDSYSFDVPEEVLEDKIPRISIQPIVENALNHGLRYVSDRERRLEILARHDGNNLVITIRDNGVGMDVEEINAALKANELGRIEKGDSIGILNVNARIKKAFGEEYGLFYESKKDEGTVVTITIPRVL